jgi:NAD dependent epimerase/dehydratase family enzyme
MQGAYNAVASEHKTNREFSETLIKVLKKTVWFPNIPATILKIIFGKMSEIILNGSRVSSNKLIKEGFQFKFPDLKSALEDLIFSNRK